MIRHWTRASRLEQIVHEGFVRPGSEDGSVMREFDTGYVAFEWHPPTEYLGGYLKKLRGEEHFPLDFDEAKLRVETGVVGKAKNDLEVPFGPLARGLVSEYVGEYVGVAGRVSLDHLTPDCRVRLERWCEERRVPANTRSEDTE